MKPIKIPLMNQYVLTITDSTYEVMDMLSGAIFYNDSDPQLQVIGFSILGLGDRIGILILHSGNLWLIQFEGNPRNKIHHTTRSVKYDSKLKVSEFRGIEHNISIVQSNVRCNLYQIIMNGGIIELSINGDFDYVPITDYDRKYLFDSSNRLLTSDGVKNVMYMYEDSESDRYIRTDIDSYQLRSSQTLNTVINESADMMYELIPDTENDRNINQVTRTLIETEDGLIVYPLALEIGVQITSTHRDIKYNKFNEGLDGPFFKLIYYDSTNVDILVDRLRDCIFVSYYCTGNIDYLILFDTMTDIIYKVSINSSNKFMEVCVIDDTNDLVAFEYPLLSINKWKGFISTNMRHLNY